MSLWFLAFLSVLQGVTELFPVSSLGHTLLVPALFGMYIDKHAPQLLPFLVALHLGTALALLWYFRARWIALIGGFFAQLGGRRNDEGHLMWALIIGTIPTGIVGLLLEKRIERVFHDLRIVAVALIVNGVLLWLGDRIQRSRAHQPPEKMTFKQAFLVGLAQVGALIPGFSRSGLTMIAGNAAGLTAEKAAEFSFLLGTPIIFAAGVLELPKLFHARDQLADALLGGVLTAIAAYLSVRFLMRYFEGRGRLASFGVYCVIAGLFCLGWFMFHPQPV
ncbi:undecaprenyl-diphosphate phosphatase [Burkholderia stagnalis]|uniref:undecaprenyl-diphosphate phosphatase n=1 Tax=Burkholderia stagnalis TaxID=1503054 RepID=UPI0007570730|nr:undecaprenyl-diphosphate phosphatase [Burkholderia stagnalis]KVC52293.1 UDP pyrophosphate phosphatase [Burkholderia stagnalis]KVN17473.1 UDP pyrophosphate phosphatase [Burkholderia stagnalis]KWI73581.1 UDP pyrophosphate phosphatase [Burkholderia stagnalis]KWK63363.1 UDP pyrophosphate phosphatase [Burkholderia stagnalis]KWN17563.1 UDP pyrophosphate phosphatase [Burkholderia stagnalis]